MPVTLALAVAQEIVKEPVSLDVQAVAEGAKGHVKVLPVVKPCSG